MIHAWIQAATDTTSSGFPTAELITAILGVVGGWLAKKLHIKIGGK